MLASVSSKSLGGTWTITPTGYDDRGRPTGYTYTVPVIAGVTDGPTPLAGDYTFSAITYRRDDQVSSMAYPPLGAMTAETVTTAYDALGSPVRLFGHNTYVDSTEYDAIGRVHTRVIGGGLEQYNSSRIYTFNDATGRLTSMLATRPSTTAGGSPIWMQVDAFSYDAVGNVLSIDHDREGYTEDHFECFTYDGRQRLATAVSRTATGCDSAVGGPGAYSRVTPVNELGNRVSNGSTTYSYPASGASSVRPHGPLVVGSASLSWNADGTLASSSVAAGVTTYSWDALDRLSQVSAPAGVSRMAYWPGGQRALLSDGSGTRLFVGGVVERDRSLSGVVSASRSYAVGGVLVGVRNKTGSAAASVTALFGDRYGSVTLGYAGVGSGGSQAGWFEPYGAVRAGGVDASSRGWIGRYADATSGLDYLDHRYYQPKWGIFLSVDPLVDTTGQAYLYANGNPSTLTDPSGLFALPGGEWMYDQSHANNGDQFHRAQLSWNSLQNQYAISHGKPGSFYGFEQAFADGSRHTGEGLVGVLKGAGALAAGVAVGAACATVGEVATLGTGIAVVAAGCAAAGGATTRFTSGLLHGHSLDDSTLAATDPTAVAIDASLGLALGSMSRIFNGTTQATEAMGPLEQGAAKVPDAWGEGVANSKGVGTKWFDPAAPKANGIRIDEGIPGSNWPSQQVDHVVVRSGGRILGPDGKAIVGTLQENPQAHIPLSDWLKWTSWNTP